MSAWLIAVVGVVYTVVAVDLLLKGNTGLGIAFVGYALGNVGLYMEAAKWHVHIGTSKQFTQKMILLQSIGLALSVKLSLFPRNN